MRRIAEIPQDDRPREKLLTRGVQSLSDLELLAAVLGSGTSKGGVLAVAGRLLKLIDEEPDVSVPKLLAVNGIGPAKAAQICAALEFARRRIRPRGVRVTLPTDVLPLVAHYASRRRERLISISLNGANEVIAVRVVSVGLVDRTHIHPREVFADPITDRAASVIIAHNHPSGSVHPSAEDVAQTRRLQAAGRTLGVELLDHVIFSPRDYYSFQENGRM